MTYKELIQNPRDGIYKTFDNKRILIEGSKLVHIPRGTTFADDQEFKEDK